MLTRLDSGSFSEVRLATCRETGKQYAAKLMAKSGEERSNEIIEIEIAILKRVNHQNIVKLYEVFDNDTSIALVIQLYVRALPPWLHICCHCAARADDGCSITGGELFE